jgi:hypothetical protein
LPPSGTKRRTSRCAIRSDSNRFDVILTMREMRDGTFHYSISKDRGATGGRGFSSSESGPPEGAGLTALEGAAGGELNMARAGGNPALVRPRCRGGLLAFRCAGARR